MADRDKRSRNREDRNEDDEELRNYWQRDEKPLEQSSFYWNITCARPDLKKGGDVLSLDPILTSLTWEDALIQTASLTVMSPEREDLVTIKEGYKLKVDYAREDGTGANWHRLWELRVTNVTQSASGDISLEAADELEWLKRSRDDFEYKKGDGKSRHKKKDGWLGHQIVEDIAKRYGIGVGHLAKCDARIEITEQNTSPLKIINQAYKKEREETGKRFVIRMEKGKLYVETLKRSRTLLILGGQLLGADVTRMLPKNVATLLSVRASSKRKKGEHKKIEVEVQASRDIRKRFGVIHNFWEIDEKVDSKAKVKKLAQREMKERLEPKREVSVTMAGEVTLRRGDSVKVGLGFIKELLYVSSVSHSVSPGDYTMDVTLSFDDPYTDEEGDATREKICKEAKKKGRRAPDFCRHGHVRNDYDPYAPGGGGSDDRRNHRRDAHTHA